MKKIIVSLASVMILVSLTGCKRDTAVVPPAQPIRESKVYHKEVVTYAQAQDERESGVLSDKQVDWTEEDFE